MIDIRPVTPAAFAVLFALAACEEQAEQPAVISNDVAVVNEAETPAEMPPMIVRSAAYRCDDGDALYVDFLSDESVVNVRDSRQDLPTALERDEGTDFTGDGRTLSGTGDEVSYSAPDRPSQVCRIAET